MRKLRRKIAHYKMQREGIQHPNRKQAMYRHGQFAGYTDSYFAQHWREY